MTYRTVDGAGTYNLWTVDVPGSFRSDVCFLDLETVKVPARPGFRLKTGEPLGRRWSAFLAGVTSYRRISLVERYGSEEAFLAGVREEIGSARTVVYRATRKFDEMILKGRFTYARRGPEDVPFYPAMPGAERLDWRCERPDPDGFWESVRVRELDSANVSGTYRTDPGLVRLHLLRDVAELIGAYGEPSERCGQWLVRVLSDDNFARDLLR
jgi:hypothetical protein